MTVIKRRLNEGKGVGGCTTLKSYAETWVMLPDESFDAAIRRVYRAIAGAEKDKRRTGRPPSNKPTRKQLEQDLKTARLAARPQPSDRTADLKLVAAQENAFEAGRDAEKRAAEKSKEAVNLQAAKAQEAADRICKEIVAAVGLDNPERGAEPFEPEELLRLRQYAGNAFGTPARRPSATILR
jgi:hypothetical protein